MSLFEEIAKSIYIKKNVYRMLALHESKYIERILEEYFVLFCLFGCFCLVLLISYATSNFGCYYSCF